MFEWEMVHAPGCTVGSKSRRWRCVPECRLVRIEPEPEDPPLLVALLDVAVGAGVSVYRRLRGHNDEKELEMEFTEHQVRKALEQVGVEPAKIDEALELAASAPRNAGALGMSDDELKGTAR